MKQYIVNMMKCSECASGHPNLATPKQDNKSVT